MLIRLGQAPASGDAVALLLDCHARIRSFLALAARIPEADPPDAPEVGDAAARVARYFGEALPLHARDEEESILPRLRGREPALDAALEEMAGEHQGHEARLRDLVGACAALADDPARHAALAPAIGDAARWLEAHFAGHLRREEELIFPALRRLLDAPADAAIVQEMRARRAGPGVTGAGAAGAPGRTAPPPRR